MSPPLQPDPPRVGQNVPWLCQQFHEEFERCRAEQVRQLSEINARLQAVEQQFDRLNTSARVVLWIASSTAMVIGGAMAVWDWSRVHLH